MGRRHVPRHPACSTKHGEVLFCFIRHIVHSAQIGLLPKRQVARNAAASVHREAYCRLVSDAKIHSEGGVAIPFGIPKARLSRQTNRDDLGPREDSREAITQTVHKRTHSDTLVPSGGDKIISTRSLRRSAFKAGTATSSASSFMTCI